MSSIVWVLVIALNGGYCMERVEIKFDTEAQCEQAKAGLTSGQRAECNPRKKVKLNENKHWPLY
jgi:hypothetical protein